MELKIKALSPKIGTEIPLPRFATAGAACMDLCACIDEAVTLAAGERRLVPTGIAIALPSADYAALVFARSGLGIKKGVCLSNGVGVIDSDYRGEIGVGLVKLGSEPYTVQPGDRIAQLMVVPVVQPTVTVAEDLDETDRGAGGFGATGRGRIWQRSCWPPGPPGGRSFCVGWASPTLPSGCRRWRNTSPPG